MMSETTTCRPKYAMGLWKMLSHAIFEHQVRHQGLLPKRLEMHPENWVELYKDCGMKYMNLDVTKPEFKSVPVVVDVQANRLKMITVENKVEYL